MEKKIKVWVKVSGTIEVTEEQLRRLKRDGVEWLSEFDNLDFVRDYSDDYVTECEIDNALRDLQTIDELEPKVIEILKGCEDNTIELDYPVNILREDYEGEYYDNVIKVSYVGCICFETPNADVFKCSLSTDEITEIYKNIINQTEK